MIPAAYFNLRFDQKDQGLDLSTWIHPLHKMTEPTEFHSIVELSASFIPGWTSSVDLGIIFRIGRLLSSQISKGAWPKSKEFVKAD